MKESSLENLISTRKERKPTCTLCSNHGVRSNLKGHKRHCPFSSCPCDPCVKGRQRRVIMREQVRLRRKQMKDIGSRPYCVTPVEPGRGKTRKVLLFFAASELNVLWSSVFKIFALCKFLETRETHLSFYKKRWFGFLRRRRMFTQFWQPCCKVVVLASLKLA